MIAIGTGIIRQILLVTVTVFCSIVYITFSRIKRFISFARPWRWKKRELEQQMSQAASYNEWLKFALEIDKIDGHDVWKLEPTFPGVYDADRLQDRLYQLREARTSHDLDLAMQTLRENLFRNLGSLSDPRLFNRCTVGTKKLVGSYLKEVVDTIDSIADSPLLSIDEREHFLADSRQAYGRTALLLSGGAAMGMMHWGVLKCLFQHGLLPPVLCGNSIGALFAAMLGIHTDAELAQLFQSPSAVDFSVFQNLAKGGTRRKLVRLLKHGVLMDVVKLETFCRNNLGDVTFEEAFRKTGRNINITLTHTPHHGCPHLLNHLTTPNLLLWSAAAASCAQPGMYAPVTLMIKDLQGDIVPFLSADSDSRWGSDTVIHPMLPMERLAELFNINHFIVSQTNPHVIPFLRSMRSTSRFAFVHKIAMTLGSECFHRIKQLAELGWWPRALGWLRAEILQPYEGDVTIVPRLSWATLSKAIDNPNTDLLAWFLQEGERGTFPYLSAIETRCRVELALHAATIRLRECMKTPRVSPDVSAWRQDALGNPPLFRAMPTTRSHIPPKRRSPPPSSSEVKSQSQDISPLLHTRSQLLSDALLGPDTQPSEPLSPILGRLSPRGSFNSLFRKSPSSVNARDISKSFEQDSNDELD